jgi:hypothetical protein
MIKIIQAPIINVRSKALKLARLAAEKKPEIILRLESNF